MIVNQVLDHMGPYIRVRYDLIYANSVWKALILSFEQLLIMLQSCSHPSLGKLARKQKGKTGGGGGD